MYQPSVLICFSLILVGLSLLTSLGHCRWYGLSTGTNDEDGTIEDDQDDRYSMQEDDFFERAKLRGPSSSDLPVKLPVLSNIGSSVDGDSVDSGEDSNDDYFDTDRLTRRAICQGATCQIQSVCGKAPLNDLNRTGFNLQSYMANGEPVKNYGEWPSYAFIRILHDNQPSNACGGTLVSDWHILTAAHCLHNSSGEPVRNEKVSVWLGDHTIGQMDAQERRFGVSSICRPKKYSPFFPVKATIHDYAVLTLTKRVKFNNYHQPACLPYTNIDTSSAQCYFVGAGITHLQNEKPVLPKFINKMRVRSKSCEPWGFGRLDNYRECYAKLNGDGIACSGDSGGPVLCLDPDSKRWTVVGLVSYGRSGCDFPSDSTNVTVFTRLTTMLPEIKAVCGI